MLGYEVGLSRIRAITLYPRPRVAQIEIFKLNLKHVIFKILAWGTLPYS